MGFCLTFKDPPAFSVDRGDEEKWERAWKDLDALKGSDDMGQSEGRRHGWNTSLGCMLRADRTGLGRIVRVKVRRGFCTRNTSILLKR